MSSGAAHEPDISGRIDYPAFIDILSYPRTPMTIIPLDSYLRRYRKQTGFTHDEIAFLCGAMCGENVGRHESGKRLPILKTALMYEFILKASVREIYEGIFYDARDIVRERAKGLRASLERKPKTPERDHKIAVLRALLDEIPEIISDAA